MTININNQTSDWLKGKTSVTVLQWIDNPTKKIVVASLKELRVPILLWSEDAYDSVGEWTTAQAETELISKLSTPNWKPDYSIKSRVGGINRF